MRSAIGWMILAVAAFYGLKHPRAALFGLVATDYIRPQSGEDTLVFWGFEGVKFSMVLTAIACGYLVFRADKFKLRWERFHGGVLWIFLAVVNSAIFAFRPELAWARVYDYFLMFLQYLFICAFLRDTADVRKLCWSIALSISFVSARYCYGKFALSEYGWEGPTGDRNELAMMIVMALPFLFVLGLTAKKLSARLLAISAVAPGALVIIFSLSRGGFLGLAAVMGYLLFRFHHKRWLVALAVVAVLAGGSLVPPEFYARIGTVKTASTQDASSMGRINAWGAARAMAADRPLTGVGVGNFLVHFARYAPDPNDIHVAHSSFFQILGDTGFPGLFAWLYLVAMLWITAARVERRIKRDNRGEWTELRYYIVAVKAAWFGYVICGAFLSQEDFDFFYQLLALTSRISFLAVPVVAAGRNAAQGPVAPAIAA